jgi:hypothetical protein
MTVRTTDRVRRMGLGHDDLAAEAHHILMAAPPADD